MGDDLQGVDVEAGIGLVEHREPRLEQQHLQDLVAFLLAAREPLVHASGQEILWYINEFHLFLDQSHELESVHRVLAARLPLRVQRGLQQVGVVHARDLDRVLERQEHAGASAFFGGERQQVLALVQRPGPP